jgi:hypothetical protein
MLRNHAVASILFACGAACLCFVQGCASQGATVSHQQQQQNQPEADNYETRALRPKASLYERNALGNNVPVDKVRAIIPIYGKSDNTRDLHDFRVLMGGSSDPDSMAMGRGSFNEQSLEWTVRVDKSGITQSFALCRGWRPLVRTPRGTAISNGTTLIARIFKDFAGERHHFYLIEGGPVKVQGTGTNPTQQELKEPFTYVTIDERGTVSAPKSLDPNSPNKELDFVRQVLADPMAADL